MDLTPFSIDRFTKQGEFNVCLQKYAIVSENRFKFISNKKDAQQFFLKNKNTRNVFCDVVHEFRKNNIEKN